MKVPSFLEFLTESKLQLFHISAGKLKYDKLVPRVPKTVDSNNDENTTIKRVCFGKSINDCISAVPYGGENLDLIRRVWHVYSPINIDIKYLYQPTEKDVPDIKRTNEIWYLKECDIKYLGMIFVTGAKNTSKVFKYALFMFSENVFSLSFMFSKILINKIIASTICNSPSKF
jgi:hypothetical protein